MDVTDREILEVIAHKLSESKILNGGFDKMLVAIEHIKEKQAEDGVKIESVYQALYNQDGAFVRLVRLEDRAEIADERVVETTGKLKELSEIEACKLAEIQANNRVVAKLKELAGPNLDNLAGMMKIQRAISKLYWLVAAGIAGAVGKFLWIYISGRH